ncbi:MAG: hypothetical protein EOP04_00145 [Proteobacteria bacterium]|nr:MAG: hypothetical protein EOP04_00145 [Pseudomonadota bacterium]
MKTRFLFIWLLLSACNGLTVFVNNPTKSFDGLKSVSLTSDGTFSLNWESASEKSEYEVYVFSSVLPPTGFSLMSNFDSDQSSFLPTRRGRVSETQALSEYRFVDEVKGSHYEFKEAVDPNLFYSFIVKLKSQGGAKNRSVALFVSKPSLGVVSNLKVEQSEKAGILTLSWAETSGALTYSLYRSPSDAEALLSTKLNNFDVAAYVERFPELCIRAQRGALLASQCLPVKTSGANAYITSVNSRSPNGYYTSGQEIYLTVSYSNFVTVAGIPELPLNNGRTAVFISGNGSNQLLFLYRVQAGDDVSFLEVATGKTLIIPAGGSIAALGPANTILPLADDSATLQGHALLTIDTIPPTKPQNVSFEADFSTSLELPLSWTSSQDTNFSKHNVKLCALDNCSTGCGSVGSTNRGYFEASGIDGNSYFACVQGEDKAGSLSAWEASTSPILVDTTVPSLVRIESVSANGYYKVGDSIVLRMVFSEPVLLSGSASLELALSVPNRKAIYTVGSGTNMLNFEFTVASGDTSSDLDVASAAALTLSPGSSLRDAAGNDAILTTYKGLSVNSLKSRANLVVDTTPPVPASLVRFDSAYSGSSSISFSWTSGFDSNFKQYNTKLCTINNCNTGCTAPTITSTSFSTGTGLDGMSYYACVQAQDMVNQTSVWIPSALPILVDLTLAGVERVDSLTTGDGSFKAGQTLEFDIVFSRAVNVTNGADIHLALDLYSTPREAHYLSGSGTTTLRFSYTIQSGDNSEDLNYQGSSALTLGALGSITASSGTAAVLTLPNLGSGNALADRRNLIVDTLSPNDPSSVEFSNAYSTSLAIPFTWIPSTDLHFIHHNIKLCASSDCTTSCGATATALGGSASISGSEGMSYYACVQGEDTLGYKSGWKASSTSVRVDTIAPTVVSVDSPSGDGLYDVDQVLLLAVNMSEPVDVVNGSSISLALEVGSNTANATYDSGSGTAQLLFKYVVKAGDATQDLAVKSPTALTLGADGGVKDAAELAANLTLPTTGAGALTVRRAIRLDTLAPSAPSSVGFGSAAINSTNFDLSWSNSVDPNFSTHNVKVCESINCATNCSTVVSAVSSPISMSGVDSKSYYGCVQGRDQLGHLTSYVPSVQSILVDTTVPTVLDVTSTTPGNLFKIGDTIVVRVKFSESVTVANGSDLYLRMATGGTGSLATYSSRAGNDTLLFNYVVAAGDVSSDLEVFSTSALSATNGTTVRDIGGNDAVFALPSLGDSTSLSFHKDFEIDGVRPTTPGSVVFSAPSELVNPAREIQWSESTDDHFDHHNVRLCESSDCVTSCITSVASLNTPKTVTGTAGKTFYACVQGQDTAGNLSPWKASTGTASIDASPVFSGVAAVDVLGSWTGVNAKIKLSFAAVPTGHITGYKVYYSTSNTLTSFDLANPLATVAKGDITFDPDPADDSIFISVPAATLEDGFYMVRYLDEGAYFPDTNSSISTGYILKGTPGFKLVPKKFSGLDYDYYLMKYEASLGAGANPGGDIVSSDETEMAKCAAKFHVDGTALDGSCGTPVIAAAAQSKAGVVPKSSISWQSAFFACRNASSNTAKIRLPTYEEWQRASRTFPTSYAEALAYAATNSASACNSVSGTLRNTGASSACLSALAINDMVGNLAEYVDYRIKPVTLSRFGSTTLASKNIRNGIDNITMQWPELNPGGATLGLAVGSYANGNATDTLGTGPVGFYDSNSSIYTGNGFRCVGFRADMMPAMNNLALANQPKYTSADLAEDVSTRRVPENNFEGDDKPERVAINITGNVNDAVPEGNVDLKWTPWSKTTCDTTGNCSSSEAGLVYKIIRFVEPNFFAVRGSLAQWAIGGASSTYATDFPFDPIGINSATWDPLYSNATSPGQVIATISNCSTVTSSNCAFNDNVSAGTNFLPTKLYRYIILVGDGTHNFRYADAQRYRSREMIGTYNGYNSPVNAAVRLEPRFRKAGVFPVDISYQNSLTPSEVMVYVPMDTSGLDRDFFIQKYEASKHSGTVNSGGGGTQAQPGSLPNCMNQINFNGSLSSCDDINLTSATTRSKAGFLPLNSLDPGDAIAACARTSLKDLDNKAYRLHLPTSAEWFKAADWGDVDFDGTIDQNSYTLGVTSIAELQASALPDLATVRCHVDNSPASFYQSGDSHTANCSSRYGAENMIGNAAEWTLDRISSSLKFRDNGVDGIWFNKVSLNAIGTTANLTYALINGYPISNGATVYSSNDTYTKPVSTSNVITLVRGGTYDTTFGEAGRFTLHSNVNAYGEDNRLGFRCSY